MFTRCPECQTTQALTVRQLRDNRGMIRCRHCSSMFDALQFISETKETGASEKDPVKSFLRVEKNRHDTHYWRLGVVVGLLVLMAQMVYFEGYALSQNPGFRVWAEKICSQLHCQLPVYRNIDEFEVMHRSLTQLPDQNYLFKIVFSNQAAFRQPYPSIDLTLLNFAGQAFAHRMLLPGDYLADASNTGLIEADATTEIGLNIAETKTKVGGFDFDFVY